ncbi:ATP synthase I chain [Thiorhodococcus drewsii AZ1]|uniref:ATP synthase I chain n=1 Tax=Thiorhodococcus drewsii AZ1 TaxID=765913 RepID=G2E796_9GAMM|nr:ATP synthase subunit I [Thiorhodococcus drewsii]EGV28002.1 ATP synthase I chain [Thiorhodococcus drewsii AZ1]
MQQPDAFRAGKILQIQVVFGLALVVFALPFGGSVALSVLLGAGICLMATALLAAWVFRGYRAQQPERLVLRFYSAETAKIVFVLGSFGAVYAVFEGINVPALLGAYFMVQVIPTLIAALFGNRTTK